MWVGGPRLGLVPREWGLHLSDAHTAPWLQATTAALLRLSGLPHKAQILARRESLTCATVQPPSTSLSPRWSSTPKNKKCAENFFEWEKFLALAKLRNGGTDLDQILAHTKKRSPSSGQSPSMENVILKSECLAK